jgi:hypothetical protein
VGGTGRIGRSYRVPKEDLAQLLQSSSTRAAVRHAAFARVLGPADADP